MTNKVYCTAPFNGIEIAEDGFIRTCCAATDHLYDLSKDGFDVINDINNNPLLKDIQKDMLEGRPHEGNCGSCARKEKLTGEGSTRNHYNTYFPDIGDNLQIKTLDLRWTNLCNLGCMYCHPYASSVWEDRLNYKKTRKIRDYQADVLGWFKSKSHEIEEVLLAGGEPMLLKQNYDLIEFLPDSTQLSITTNLSYNLQEIPCIDALLSRPKENTTWIVSVENTKEQFEYIRNNATWDTFYNNLKFLNNNFENQVIINYVYGIFSAFTMLDTVQTISGLGIHKYNFIAINQEGQNKQCKVLNMFQMPTPIRELAATEIEKTIDWHYANIHPDDRDFYPLASLSKILDSLKTQYDTNLTLDEFTKGIDYLDLWNKKKFSELWPDVWKLINLHLQ